MSKKILSLFLPLMSLGIMVYWVFYVINTGIPDNLFTMQKSTNIFMTLLANIFVIIMGLVGGHGLFHNLDWGETAASFSCGLFAYSALSNLNNTLFSYKELTILLICVFLTAIICFIYLFKLDNNQKKLSTDSE